MARRGSTVPVRKEEDLPEGVIRGSLRMMVPEVRASGRSRRSSLQPAGLPPPGKTTQGLRPSIVESRDSSRPRSFRTIRNFWKEREEDNKKAFPLRREMTPFKKPKIQAEPEETKSPPLGKLSVKRQESQRRPSLKESIRKSSKQNSKSESISRPVIQKLRISDRSRTSRTSEEPIRRTKKLESTTFSPETEEFPYKQNIARTSESISARKSRIPSIPDGQDLRSSKQGTGRRSRGMEINNQVPGLPLDETYRGEGREEEVDEEAAPENLEEIDETEHENEEEIYEGEHENEEEIFKAEHESDEEIEEKEVMISKKTSIDQSKSRPTLLSVTKDYSRMGEVPDIGTPFTPGRPTRAISELEDVRTSSLLWNELPRMFSDETLRLTTVILPVLLEEEKLFHELVAGGDVSSVADFLQKRPNFNVNCVNYQGTSALHIAVKEDNEDMVQYLLSLRGIVVGDSHLFAIRDNNIVALRMILDNLHATDPELESMACSNSPEFPENVTPLILAAEAGHYEIIGLLLSRGHRIPRPHKPRCFCKEECQAMLKIQDYLSVSSGKLHIYRALSNPAYICQTTHDPLLIAFRLSKELLECGEVDSIYIRQYEALADSLRRFAVDLIAECRTMEEVETILSESKDSNLKGDWTYPRLIMAMDYKQKDFVAHPNVQQVLERTWIGDWLAWRGYRVYVKAFYIFPTLLSLPAILVILIFLPTTKLAKYYSLPVNKLLSNVASYTIFLLLVFIQSNVDKKHQTRDTKPTGVEIFLVIYVLAFIYNSFRSLFKQGVRRFFKFMWNIYELIMELFFVMSFIFLIASEIRTTIKGNKHEERKYWNYWDFVLISESFFVLATIMAFMRILLIFQISYHLGPLQVSLGKMTNDCAMFSMIFGIIILAFTAGLCRFYSYYEDMVQTNPETGDVQSTQENSFTSVQNTFKTLFWGLFSMTSYDVADVVVENIEDKTGNSTLMNEHHLTESVGYVIFAIYMILIAIVILNMLIATMSNTFQKVTDNVDTEWVFGRTEVYLAYIDTSVMPPPFNVLPTTHAFMNFFKRIKNRRSSLKGKDIEKGPVVQEKMVEEYYILMSQLVQRYFSTKNSDNE